MNQSSNGCLKDVLGSNWKEKKLNRQRLLRHRGNSSLISKSREITISFSDTDKPTLELFKLSPPTNSNLIFWLASSHVSHWVLSNLCDPSVHGIIQARILEWVTIPFYKGSSWPRIQSQVSCIAAKSFTVILHVKCGRTKKLEKLQSPS